MHLLHEPHHDGSPLYLSDEAPVLNSRVTVRVRTAAAQPPDAIWLRTTYDAEPTFAPCERKADQPDDDAVWWSGELLVHNPVAHYRFLLQYGEHQVWLTAAGVIEHDCSDTFDFKVSTHRPAPDWAREGVVYQIFPDRFARSATADERPTPAWAVPAAWDDTVVFEGSDPHTPLQFFGGDLDGLIEHLDHLEATGATILYTTPVFPGESNHRYNASTFDTVDPLLGGDEAYGRLAAAVHERGWRLLGDLTTNHTGDTHEWFAAARQGGPTHDWYCFNPDGSYESWMGHHTLPKLNLANSELRSAMVEGPDSVVARWLRPPFDVDGWRIDVANMTGRLGASDVNHATARAVRATATAERDDALVIGEHNHDASGDIDGDGWHGTMNYSGFSWPVWSWLRDPASPARAFGRPLPVAVRSGEPVLRTLREWNARYGWRAAQQSWNILGSHDSARIRTLVSDPALHRVAAGLQFTLPGTPMVFAGDEIGLEGVLGEDSRRPMPWARPESWDTATLAHYSALSAVRSSHPALVYGSLRWAYVDADAIAYLREHPDGDLLVLARRANGSAIELPLNRTATCILGSEGDLSDLAASGSLTLPAGGAGFWIWRLSE